MKKQVLKSLFLAGLLLLLSLPAGAVYEQPVSVSDPVYYASDETTVISGPQAGVFYVKLDATYSGSDTRTARALCAVYDKTSGVIKSIAASNVASWPGSATQALTVRLEPATVENCEFRCFLVDDLQNHRPLANQAPGTPGTPTVSNITGSSATISWEAADDDFQNVTGYKIYKDGMEVGETTSTGFGLTNLMRNTPATVSVKTNDGQLLSQAAETEVTPAAFPVLSLDSANKGTSLIESERISFYYAAAGAGLVTDAGVVAGLPGYMFVAGKYPSFAVNTSYFTENDNRAVLEVTYLDRWSEGKTSQTPIYVQVEQTSSADPTKTVFGIAQVDDPQNPGTSISQASRFFPVTNTGVWRTEVRTLTNAKFTAAGVLDGGLNKHLRLYTTSGASDVYLAKVSLTKPEDYVPMNPNMVVDGGMIVYGMSFTLAGGYDVAYTLTEKEGVDCAASTAAGNLSFKVTDSAVLAAPAAKLEVRFYDDNAGDTLRVGNRTVAMDGSGWRSVIFDMTAAQLGDISISTHSGGTVYLKSLQAYAA